MTIDYGAINNKVNFGLWVNERAAQLIPPAPPVFTPPTFVDIFANKPQTSWVPEFPVTLPMGPTPTASLPSTGAVHTGKSFGKSNDLIGALGVVWGPGRGKSDALAWAFPNWVKSYEAALAYTRAQWASSLVPPQKMYWGEAWATVREMQQQAKTGVMRD